MSRSCWVVLGGAAEPAACAVEVAVYRREVKEKNMKMRKKISWLLSFLWYFHYLWEVPA